MVKAYRVLLNITVSSFLNRTVYYLRRLPFIRRAIPETLYESADWKRAAAIIVLIAQLLWAVANKIIYLGLLMFIPAKAMSASMTDKDPLQLFFVMLLPLSFLTACIWNARVLEPKRDKYVAVKLLRIPAAAYMKTTLAFRYVTFFMSFLISLMIFVPLLGGTALDGAIAAVVLTAWRLIAEWLHIKLFERTGKILIRDNAIVWLSILFGGALAYGLPLLGVDPEYGMLLLAWPIALPVATAGIAAALSLARYVHYPEAVASATKRDDPLLNLGQLIADKKKAEVASKANDFTEEDAVSDIGAASGPHGYAHINRLFFQRHRRLVRKPFLNRLVISIVAGAVASIALALLRGDKEWSLMDIAPYLPFFLYNIVVGEQLCRAMFYNCDMPLMRYRSYRQAAWKHFSIRLIRLSGMNLLLAAALGGVLTLMASLTGGLPNAAELAALWTLLLSVALLLSVHHLSLYYLLQPYTTELDAKNPFHLIVNMIFSALLAMTFVIQPPITVLAACSLGLLLLYLLVAPLLIRRFGSVTFKIR